MGRQQWLIAHVVDQSMEYAQKTEGTVELRLSL